jgi:hypothetical protein
MARPRHIAKRIRVFVSSEMDEPPWMPSPVKERLVAKPLIERAETAAKPSTKIMNWRR